MAKLLSGKVVLVAGKSRSLAGSVIRRFLQEDAIVLVPSQSMHELNLLTASLTDIDTTGLITLLTDYPDYYKAFELAELMIQRFGKIDLAVFCFDDKLKKNSLLETDIIDWEKMIDEHVTAYFVCARILLSAMKKQQDGMFISLNKNLALNEKCLGALAALAYTMQKKMAQMFGIVACKYHVKWHHISLMHLKDREPGGDINTAYSAGDCVLKLYSGEVNDAANVFQSFALQSKDSAG